MSCSLDMLVLLCRIDKELDSRNPEVDVFRIHRYPKDT